MKHAPRKLVTAAVTTTLAFSGAGAAYAAARLRRVSGATASAA